MNKAWELGQKIFTVIFLDCFHDEDELSASNIITLHTQNGSEREHILMKREYSVCKVNFPEELRRCPLKRTMKNIGQKK